MILAQQWKEQIITWIAQDHLNMSWYDTQLKYEDNFLGTSCVVVFVFVEKSESMQWKIKLWFLTRSQSYWFESVWRKQLGKTQHNGTNSKLWLWFEGWVNPEEKDWQCH